MRWSGAEASTKCGFCIASLYSQTGAETNGCDLIIVVELKVVLV